MGHLQFPEHSNIFLDLVVAVTSYVPRVIVENSEGGVGELVPYAEAFPISSPTSLNLPGGENGAINSLQWLLLLFSYWQNYVRNETDAQKHQHITISLIYTSINTHGNHSPGMMLLLYSR